MLHHGWKIISLTSCIEILETGDFRTYRDKPTRELLLDIRGGKYALNEIVEMMDCYDNKINELYETSTLPKTPDYNKVNSWLIGLNKAILYNYYD